MTPDQTMEKLPLQKVLDYELVALIGKGASSEVYKGKKEDRFVAIKIMVPPAHLDAELLVAALRYEFWVLKDLAHPNIIRILDFGQLPDGRLFLVEEFLEGLPLDVYCRERSFAECEPLFCDILKGLSELQRCQIVHGDLKAANILVTRTGDKASAKILDFGMAHSLTAKDGIAAPRISGGTPSTMAPEVILQHESTHRSDLYSLGVTFYAALAGKNPFVGQALAATYDNHLHVTPEPLGLLRRDLPPPWAELIHKMLAKNPLDRPDSALKALSLVQKEGFVLSPTAFVGHAALFKILPQLEAALKNQNRIALVVNGARGSGVSRFVKEIFYRLIVQHPEQREAIALNDAAPNPKKNILLLERMPAPADDFSLNVTLPALTPEEMTEWLKSALNVPTLPPEFLAKMTALSAGHPATLWDLLTRLAEQGLLADATGQVTRASLALIPWETVLSQPDNLRPVQEDFDWVLQNLQRRVRKRNLSAADPLWQSVNDLAGKGSTQSANLKRRAQVLALRGESLIDAGQWEAAREALVSAREIFSSALDSTVDAIRTRNFLAYILLRQGKIPEAVQEFEAAAAEVKTRLPEERDRITNLDLGLAYLQAGNFPAAVKRLNDELKFHRQQKENPDESERDAAAARAISCLYNRAQAKSALKDHAAAEADFRQVLTEAHERHDPFLTLRAQNGLGNVLRQLGKWREALLAYSEAVTVALALRDFAAAATAVQNRGALAAANGLLTEATRDLEDSLKYAHKISPHYAFEKTLICRSYIELGEVFAQQALRTQAVDALNRAWHLAETDDDLKNFRFWVLRARCRTWLTLQEDDLFKQDLARLNFTADDDDKKAQYAQLEARFAQRQNQDQTRPEAILETFADQPLQELNALLRINRDLVGEMTRDELLRRLLTHAIELSGAELGVILLADEKGALAPQVSLNADLSEELSAISLSVAQQALASGKTIKTADAASETEFNQYASVMALNLKSILGVPILFRGKVLGVLYLSHRYRLSAFGERTARIVEAFADQAGLALTNHRLLEFYRTTQEKLREELDLARVDLAAARETRKTATGPVITQSPPLLAILEQVARVADSNVTIVIHGETGTGKEVLARFIHDSSPRKRKPFIAINCGALPVTLVESELFGHARGAFTGADRDKVGLIEAANGGTLFLDEVAELPAPVQVRLLRVLQEREVLRVGETKPRPVDVRIISAAHKSLREGVADGSFREDVYYRLMGFEIDLPPLRERIEDLPLLAEHFLNQYRVEFGRSRPERIGAQLLRVMAGYAWPGNVRELKSVVQTAAAFDDGKIIGTESLPKYLLDRLKSVKSARRPTERKEQTAEKISETDWYQPGLTWKEHELLIYVSACIALDFNPQKVATSLKVGVATVYKWLRENRIHEDGEAWRSRAKTYQPGTTLESLRAEIFTKAAERHCGHPYHAARELGVAPVTFYRWAKRQPCDLMKLID